MFQTRYNPAGSYSFELRDVEERKTLVSRATCAYDQIAPTVRGLFVKVLRAMRENGVRMSGPPFCLYLAWRDNECEIEAGCPVEGLGPMQGDVYMSETPGGNTLVSRFVGPYDRLPGAHRDSAEYAEEHGMQVVGAPWEVYVTDPEIEPDPTKWITELYYPVA